MPRKPTKRVELRWTRKGGILKKESRDICSEVWLHWAPVCAVANDLPWLGLFLRFQQHWILCVMDVGKHRLQVLRNKIVFWNLMPTVQLRCTSGEWEITSDAMSPCQHNGWGSWRKSERVFVWSDRCIHTCCCLACQTNTLPVASVVCTCCQESVKCSSVHCIFCKRLTYNSNFLCDLSKQTKDRILQKVTARNGTRQAIYGAKHASSFRLHYVIHMWHPTSSSCHIPYLNFKISQ